MALHSSIPKSLTREDVENDLEVRKTQAETEAVMPHVQQAMGTTSRKELAKEWLAEIANVEMAKKALGLAQETIKEHKKTEEAIRRRLVGIIPNGKKRDFIVVGDVIVGVQVRGKDRMPYVFIASEDVD